MTTPARLSQSSSRGRSDGCAGADGLLDAFHNHKITRIFTRKNILFTCTNRKKGLRYLWFTDL
ncbi:hypothetical protein CW713_12385 [Methanophagales archaeon]|nr:MAG: hypothetical protein CW713_12385 [Methanophagales archaeon]